MVSLETFLSSVHFYDILTTTESHSTPYGQIVCTGKGCIGCLANYNPNSALPIDVISFQEPHIDNRPLKSVRKKVKAPGICSERVGERNSKTSSANNVAVVKATPVVSVPGQEKRNGSNRKTGQASLKPEIKRTEHRQQKTLDSTKIHQQENSNDRGENEETKISNTENNVKGFKSYYRKKKLEQAAKFETTVSWATLQETPGRCSLLDALRRSESGQGVYILFKEHQQVVSDKKNGDKVSNDAISNNGKEIPVQLEHNQHDTNVSEGSLPTLKETIKHVDHISAEQGLSISEKKDELIYCLDFADQDALSNVTLLDIQLSLEQIGIDKTQQHLIDRKDGQWKLWVRGTENKQTALERGLDLDGVNCKLIEDNAGDWSGKS